MAALIVQILDARNRVRSTHPIATLPVTIGRGYHNDVILADGYVCPMHARIYQTESGWRIEDRSSKNGVAILNRNETVSGSAPLNSGDVLVLGKTYVRILRPDHPVPESKSLKSLKRGNHKPGRLPLFAWWMTLVCLLMVALDFYLDLGDDNVSEELFQITIAIMVVLGLVVVWSAGWSFIGRVLKHQTHFHFHLLLAVCGIILIELLMYANNFIAYNTCNASLRDLINILAPIIVIGALFALSIRAATRLPTRYIHLISTGIVLLFAAVFLLAEINSRGQFDDSPDFDAVLYTPWAQVVQGESLDQFLQGNERLFDKLEKWQTEEMAPP
jgi:pSer/pThr/pTyr-binding forkhead associated (FHA) protein